MSRRYEIRKRGATLLAPSACRQDAPWPSHIDVGANRFNPASVARVCRYKKNGNASDPSRLVDKALPSSRHIHVNANRVHPASISTGTREKKETPASAVWAQVKKIDDSRPHRLVEKSCPHLISSKFLLEPFTRVQGRRRRTPRRTRRDLSP